MDCTTRARPRAVERPHVVADALYAGICGSDLPQYRGECDACVRGEENLCEPRGLSGLDRPGVFADSVVVAEAALVAVPDEMTARRLPAAARLARLRRARGGKGASGESLIRQRRSRR